MNWHKIAAVALGIGSFCATKFIPAALVLTLGPFSIPVAATVSVVIAGAAALGVVPEKVSPTVANIINNLSIKGSKPNA